MLMFMKKKDPFMMINDLKEITQENQESELSDPIPSHLDYPSLSRSLTKPILIILFYLGLITLSEILTTYHDIRLGLVLSSLIIFLLLVHSSLIHEDRIFSNVLRAMMILPMIRIVGLTVPLSNVDPLYWFIIISIPLFAATITFVKIQNMSRKDLGLIKGNIPVQLAIVASGFFLGYVEYEVLAPPPLIPRFDPVLIIYASIILIIGTGLAEELLFRGVLQQNMEKMLGPLTAILLSSLLFTSLHIGWQSYMDLLFVFGVSLFYGLAFYKTRCLWGVTLSHGINNAMLFLVMPFIIL